MGRGIVVQKHRAVCFLRGDNTIAGRLEVGSEPWAMVVEHQARRKIQKPAKSCWLCGFLDVTFVTQRTPPSHMKTFHFLFFLLLQVSAPLYGQSWFDGNPRWTNRYYGGTGGLGIEYVHISGDTILGGKPAKIFSKVMYGDSGFLNYQQQRYAYQSGDTIFTWKEGAFSILYNFSLMPGDTLLSKVYVSGGLVNTFVIDSVGQTEISGQTLRFQKVRMIPPNVPNHQKKILKNTIIEKIGMVNGTLNVPASPLNYEWSDHFFMNETFLFGFDFPGWRFCNYSNDDLILEDLSGGCPPWSPACAVLVKTGQSSFCQLPVVVATGEILYPCNAPASFLALPAGSLAKISYYQTACPASCGEGIGVNITCHSPATNSLLDVGDASAGVRLYPNPAKGDVFIENFEPEQVQLFDQRGALVRTTYTTSAARFSVTGLPSGCYIVKMSNWSRVLLRKIWVE